MSEYARYNLSGILALLFLCLPPLVVAWKCKGGCPAIDVVGLLK